MKLHKLIAASFVARVQGNAARLQNAIMNLVTNARDAMPQGGEIALALTVLDDDALITVRDQGIGMTDSVREQLFTPFFTTKGELGTGLGLRIVRSVAEEHGGEIEFQSEPGAGTLARLRLPLAHKSLDENYGLTPT